MGVLLRQVNLASGKTDFTGALGGQHFVVGGQVLRVCGVEFSGCSMKGMPAKISRLPARFCGSCARVSKNVLTRPIELARAVIG